MKWLYFYMDMEDFSTQILSDVIRLLYSVLPSCGKFYLSSDLSSPTPFISSQACQNSSTRIIPAVWLHNRAYRYELWKELHLPLHVSNQHESLRPFGHLPPHLHQVWLWPPTTNPMVPSGVNSDGRDNLCGIIFSSIQARCEVLCWCWGGSRSSSLLWIGRFYHPLAGMHLETDTFRNTLNTWQENIWQIQCCLLFRKWKEHMFTS